MEELIAKVDLLKELEESFRHSIGKAKEGEISLEQTLKYLIEWGNVKKQIKLITIDKSSLVIPGSENQEARQIIQKIKLDEKLLFESKFAGTPFEALFETELSDDEIDSLESDLFYSWFSGYDFVKEPYNVKNSIALCLFALNSVAKRALL